MCVAATVNIKELKVIQESTLEELEHQTELLS